MADYEKKISSIDKEIINIIKHLDKQKKLPKNQEPVATVSELNDAEPDSAAPIQEAQTKTSMGKGKFEKEQEFSLVTGCKRRLSRKRTREYNTRRTTEKLADRISS
ncbi:hypothetical protein YC2023_066126 [Brassica napus]